MEPSKNPEQPEMTEGQKNFYKAKREHVQRCLESGDIDAIAKVCEFILNQSEQMLKANEELKRKLTENTMRYEEIVRKVNAEKDEAKKSMWQFYGALKSCYAVIDKWAGNRIREDLRHNIDTGKAGMMKKLMEEMAKLSA